MGSERQEENVLAWQYSQPGPLEREIRPCIHKTMGLEGVCFEESEFMPGEPIISIKVSRNEQ